jgi:hypothetical protein
MKKLLFLLFAYTLAIPAIPTWRQGMNKGQWNVIPAATLANSAGYTGSGTGNRGTGNMMVDWGGAVLVTRGLYIGSTFTNGTFLVPWGGGHTDYGGNEMVAFGPLENNSPTWNRLRDSTSPHPVNVCLDGSNNPVSRHTYNSCVYYADSLKMFCMGGPFRFTDGSSCSNLFVYNFNQISPNSNQPWSTKASLPGDFGDVATSDLALGKIWYHRNANNNITTYNVSANTYTADNFRSPLGYGGNAMSALDSARGILCYWDNALGLSFYRTNNGTSNDYYRPTTTGSTPYRAGGSGTSTNNCSVTWAKAKDLFIFKCQQDSGAGSTANVRSFWYLIPPATNPYAGGNAWTWREVTPSAGASPTTVEANGTFGRFQWIDNADIRGLLLENDATDSLYFYLDSTATTASTAPAFFKALQGVGN